MAPLAALRLVAGNGIAKPEAKSVEIRIRSQGQLKRITIFLPVDMLVALEKIDVKGALLRRSC